MDVRQQSDVPAKSLTDEIATFLIATAAVLRETIVRFEQTTARITENVATRPDRPDRDLIVTLQDFDRLQQEFATLAEVLAQAAAKPSESWLRTEAGRHPGEDAIAMVSISELKERLMSRLGISMMDLTLAPTGEEVVF